MHATQPATRAGTDEAAAGAATARTVAPAFLLFGASLFLVVTLGFAAQAHQPLLGLAFTELALILGVAVWFVRRARLPVRAGLRLAPVRPRVALLAAAVGVTGWGVAVALHQLLAPALGSSAGGAPALQAVSVGTLLLALLVGALLPGICEEALFRGTIQGVLERRGARFAVVVAAALFGVYHLAPATIVPAFALGLVFGTIVVRTGSTIAAIIAHTMNNATAIIAGFLLQGRAGGVPITLIASLAGGFLLFGALFLLATRGARVAAAPLATLPAAAAAPAAGRGRLPRRALRIAAVAVLVLGIALAGMVWTVVRVQRVQTYAFAPLLEPGDRAIIVLDRSRSRPLRTDDVVLYRPTDGAAEVLGRVLRTDGDRVWIGAADAAIEVSRTAVAGKVVNGRRPAEGR